MKMLVPQLSTSLFGKPATAGKALSGLAFPLITLSLALLQFAASNAAAQSTPVTPPGAIFNAGSVVPYKLLAGNMAGGFLGNGSGKDYDVAVGNGTGSGPQLFVFLGNGDGSFQAPASYTFTGTGAPSGIYLMYAGPIFSANETDLVFTDNGSKLFVLKGNGDGTFTGNTPVYLGQTAYPMKVFLNPSNNTLNIIATVGTYNSATQQTTYAVTVFVNNGSGQFTQQTVPGLGTFPVADVEYLEINSTPSLLIVGSNGTAEASTYSAGSQGTPTSVNLNLPTGSALYQVTPFEVASGFGFAAFVIQGSTTNLEAWLPGSTAGTFQSPATVANLTAYSPVQLATADINQDGYPDLVALGGGSFTTAQYILPFYGSSSGAFSAPATSPAVIGPGVYGGEMVVGNVNADAYPDIVLAQQNQGLTVLLNQANGSFPSPETYTATPPLISGTPTPDVPVGLAAADLTGTGYDDVVLANGVNTSTNPATNTDTITSFLNAGTSTSQPRFTDKGDFDTNNQPDAIALAVANSKQSAFVANEVSGNISFLQGNGDGTFQSESTISGGPLSARVALKQTHGRYAAYWNAAHTTSGHAWQGRFYSCPLDEAHLWQALRYTELNPVRAKMAAEAVAWPWSSAAAHCGTGAPDACLDMVPWGRRWSAASWRKYLDEGETASELDALRRCTHTGRPLGSAEFVDALEQNTQRRLAPQKGGRPRKPVADARQEAFTFPKRTRQSARTRPPRRKKLV